MPNYNQATKKVVQAVGVAEDLSKVKIITKEEASEIIEERLPRGLFVLKEKDKYIGIDNTTGDAWLEEFNYQEDCIKWLLAKGEGQNQRD